MKWFRLDLPPERVHQLVAELEQLIALDVSHAGLAAPLAAGLTGVSAYLAQDFVAAESLDVVIRDSGPARAADAMRVASQLASAVDAASAAQIVHGALHPRDVLLTADDARMTGFGVARALERIGVPPPVRRPYTAPERIAGLTWDHRADLFSVAALVYEYVTGRRIAGVGAEAVGTLEIPGADADALTRVFVKALAGNPAERFESGHAFVAALEDAFSTKAVVPPPVKRARHTSRKTEAPPARPALALDDAPLFAVPPVTADTDWQIERESTVRHEVPLHLDDLPMAESFEEPVIQLDRADDNPALHADTPVRAALREDPAHMPHDRYDALHASPAVEPEDLHIGHARFDDETEIETGRASSDWSHAAPEPSHIAPERLAIAPEPVHDPLHEPLHVAPEPMHADADAEPPLVNDPAADEPEWSDLSPESVQAAADVHRAAVEFEAARKEWRLEPEDVHGGREWTHGALDEPDQPADLHLTPDHTPGEPDLHLAPAAPQASPEQAPRAAAAATPDFEYSIPKRRRSDRDLPPVPLPEPSRFALDGIWPLTLALVVGVAIGFGMALVLIGGNAQVPVDEVAAERPAAPPVVVSEDPIVPEGARPGDQPAAGSNAANTAPAGAGAPAAGAVASLPPGIVAPAAAGTGDAAAPVPPVVHESAATPPAVREPPPSRAAAPVPGRLVVRSTPAGAAVTLDGKRAGVTPLTLRDLARGRHSVRVARDGYVAEERTVSITDAEPAPTLTVALARIAPERRATPAAPPSRSTASRAPAARGASASRGTTDARSATATSDSAARSAGLLVESRPSGARVTVDGRVVGVTPLTLSSIAVGQHTVSIERPGYRPWASTVTVAAGARARVAASLEQ